MTNTVIVSLVSLATLAAAAAALLGCWHDANTWVSGRSDDDVQNSA
ncbi:MAG: hypothetical protein AAF267_15060 [Deinococcota bacterium]